MSEDTPQASKNYSVIMTIALICIITAVALPWLGMGMYVVSVLCVLTAFILGIVLLFMRAFGAGAIILIVSIVAGLISLLGYGMSYARETGMVDYLKEQESYFIRISEAKAAGNTAEAERLEKERQKSSDQYLLELKKRGSDQQQ